ncbi:hypothetical protein VTN77DRAFT_8031 [Rasamsonia byssochlamydoides]|uniref:uncharacterized protein n=1 Tax=Rasamsonia byssochlamydoides TaxID=89139 RepID=UPI0037444BB1
MDSNNTPAGDASAGPADEAPQAPRTIILHILSPSFENPNRLTFDNLPLTTTVGALKERITESIPSRPSAAQQRLIYRGKPLLNDSVMLQNILEPSDDSVYSLHLVLPPRPAPSDTANASASTSSSSATGASPAVPGLANHLPSFNMPPSQNYIQSTQTIRFRTTLNQPSTSTPSGPEDSDLSNATAALRRNIESLRRQLEVQTQARRQQQQQHQSVLATGRSPGLPTLPFQSFSSHLRPLAPTPPAPGGGLLSVPNLGLAANSDSILGASANATLLEMETRRLRLVSLQQQISVLETQVGRGIAPPIDSIISIRNQLYSIIDDQYRNPSLPRDGQAEALLGRIQSVYVRADQLRVLHSRRPVAFQNDAVSPAPVYGAQYPLYLLASPAGYQAVLVSPAGLAAMQPSPSVVPQQTTSVPARQDPAPVMPPNPVQPAMENVVRQVVLNQAVQDNQQDMVARNARRVWLFIRLYFFCYLFSESGTWSRFIFVSLAILISLLSETGLPQRLHRAVIDPVQRHLEGLVHAGGEEQVRPGQANRPDLNGNLAEPAAGNREPQRPIIPAEMQHGLRRVERAVALFIASLVPGVGERHVEVRNAAAEAARNAERAREEEERRRHEEQRRNEERVGEPSGTTNHEHEQREASAAAAASEGSPSAQNVQNRNSTTTAIPRDDA